MGKVLGAFIAGFSLAMCLIFLTIFVYVTPFSADINNAFQINEQIYATSHSEWYSGATSFLQSISGLSNLPIVGSVAQWGSSIGDFLHKVKETSASLRNTLGLVKFLADISSIATIIFAVLFFAGLGLIKSDQSQMVQIQPMQPVEKSKFCSECGTKNLREAKFCESCGEKI